MTATISRASTALNTSSPTAAHESALAQLFAEVASEKILQNLKAIETCKKRDEKLVAIADAVFEEMKYIPSHPTGVNS
jgi:hypothetical protein